MSVIHVKKRSTKDYKIFNESSSSDKSLLWLSDKADVESFSIDLTVGQEWSEKYGPESNAMHEITEAGIQILRHGSVVVAAAEEIRVPYNMYGILVPTGSLFLDKGVLIAPAKVEPAFQGNLKLRLFNTTGIKHRLKKGDKLGSVVFFSTETTQFQEPITKKSILVAEPVPIRRRMLGWVRAYGGSIAKYLFLLCSGSVGAALLLHFVLQPYFPNNSTSAASAASAASATPSTGSPASTPTQRPKNKP